MSAFDMAKTTARSAALLLIVFATSGCQRKSPTDQNEPMELRGRWLEMGLAGSESQAARALGVPMGVNGVVVVDVDNTPASRAQQAGLQVGDVVIGIGGQSVKTLTDVYPITTKLNLATPVSIDILRRGQPMQTMIRPITVAGMQPFGGAVGMLPPTGCIPGSMGCMPLPSQMQQPMIRMNP